MQEVRRVSLFRNGKNQAVRIPREWEFDADDATIERVGDSLVIKPIARSGLSEWLTSLPPLEQPFPEVEDLPLENDLQPFP